jgi:hypothetical protein
MLPFFFVFKMLQASKLCGVKSRGVEALWKFYGQSFVTKVLW